MVRVRVRVRVRVKVRVRVMVRVNLAMRLLDQTEVLIQYRDLLDHQVKKPQKPTQQRSKGVHLSDILKYLYFGSIPPGLDKKEVKRRMQEAQEDLEGVDPTVMNLRMVLGMAWESFAVGFMPDTIWQPKEMLVDGIAGSMDGWTFADYEDDPVPVIEEFKFTHKSFRPRSGVAILDDVLWIRQIKGYAYMAMIQKELDDPPQARLHICYANGDYERPFKERYIRYLIKFEREELVGFWQRAILPNKAKAMKWKEEQEQGGLVK